MGDEFVNTVWISRLEGLDECNDLRLLMIHLVELFQHLSVGLESLFNADNMFGDQGNDFPSICISFTQSLLLRAWLTYQYFSHHKDQSRRTVFLTRLCRRTLQHGTEMTLVSCYLKSFECLQANLFGSQIPFCWVRSRHQANWSCLSGTRGTTVSQACCYC